MKKIVLSILLLSVCFSAAYAQTTIYSQNFNSTTTTVPPGWSLNTADDGGTTSLSDNQWIINNVYAHGLLGTTTPDEPSRIVGYPESYYLHMYSAAGATLFGDNDNYDATGDGETFFASTGSVSTLGYTGVTFSFWWICAGDAEAVGKVYYRTSGTGLWTQITAPVATFNFSPNWYKDSVTLSEFVGQAYLQFGFQFSDGTLTSGADPAFGIDDIFVTGTLTTTVTPTPSFSVTATTACQDSCITFTNTSVGGVDSFTWATTPAVTITNPRISPETVCFSSAGVYTMTLTDWHNGTPYTVTHTFTVSATPHPVLTRSGYTLSVPSLYTFYQWYNGFVPIPGANTNSYTFSGVGIDTFTVLVDSGGCPGISTPFIFDLALGVTSINGIVPINFWTTQSSGQINLYASQPLDKTVSINIYDATGRQIITDTWPAASSTKQVQATYLPPGMYIIKLTNETTAVALRLIR